LFCLTADHELCQHPQFRPSLKLAASRGGRVQGKTFLQDGADLLSIETRTVRSERGSKRQREVQKDHEKVWVSNSIKGNEEISVSLGGHQWNIGKNPSDPSFCERLTGFKIDNGTHAFHAYVFHPVRKRGPKFEVRGDT